MEDVIEMVNSLNWYNHIIEFDTSFHSMILTQKSLTWYLQQEESTAKTPFDVFFKFGMKSSLAWNAAFWLNFIFIMVRNHLTPKFTGEDFRIQVRGPPANYLYGCHLTPVTRGSHWYLSYQKGIIQGHPGHRYETREALGLCYRIVFRTVYSLDVSTQTVFLYYMLVRKKNWNIAPDKDL